MSEKQSLYSLNYFNKVGRIELVRLIFAVAKIPYTDNFIEKLTDRDQQTGYMPYLKLVNEKCEIPCISVISRFLAREFNLAGKTNVDQVSEIIHLFIFN